MSTLKLGIVGAGFVAHFHARALKQVRNVDVVGVSSLMNAESLSGFVKSNHLGEGTIYPDVGELAKHVEELASSRTQDRKLKQRITEALRQKLGLRSLEADKTARLM